MTLSKTLPASEMIKEWNQNWRIGQSGAPESTNPTLAPRLFGIFAWQSFIGWFPELASAMIQR
jgi:hypothetical protein